MATAQDSLGCFLLFLYYSKVWRLWRFTLARVMLKPQRFHQQSLPCLLKKLTCARFFWIRFITKEREHSECESVLTENINCATEKIEADTPKKEHVSFSLNACIPIYTEHIMHCSALKKIDYYCCYRRMFTINKIISRLNNCKR